MRDVEFDEPVDVLAGKDVRRVSTAGQAAVWLLERWPTEPGRKHRAARQALIDLLEGAASASYARQAFEAAADEAEIRIGGWHRGNPVAVFMSKHKPMVGAPVPRPRKR